MVDNLIESLQILFNGISFEGSGWSIDKIDYVFLEEYDNKPIRGSSYIPTPEKFKNRKCGLINIQNDDRECFK